ncbi:hypothetical protein NDU88_003792 [Pleurodeles waltl]|uniref:Uncharacterized protein n=1 Tax=Pleurodeles waltl TaxID=8319 RepID=A0AAV7VHV1_PLEWA|nr:hypothetical protein NDU88_003792 [Pleurodeles waltl]
MDDMEQSQEGETQSTSIKAMLMYLKQGLAGIDAKVDHPTDYIDRLKDRVDDHDTRLDQEESQTSGLEDGRRREGERLLRMERVLELIRNKNKDLEARSRRNNLRILGVPKSTDMSCMDDYVLAQLQRQRHCVASGPRSETHCL